MISPDFDIANTFLTRLAAKNDISFQTYSEADGTNIPPQFRHGTLSKYWKELTAQNSAGVSIHVMINAGDGIGTKTENVKRVRAFFVDLDKDGASSLENVKKAPLKPHIIVESSPGKYHAYWLVNDVPLEEFSPVQTALAEK